jgi:hypothetical protein
VLGEKGRTVTVLNNERGFSAANVRALCDVGRSTKGSGGLGYIGQKGIGFKSVFRVRPLCISVLRKSAQTDTQVFVVLAALM